MLGKMTNLVNEKAQIMHTFRGVASTWPHGAPLLMTILFSNNHMYYVVHLEPSLQVVS